MKKLIVSAILAASTAMAFPAMAQVSSSADGAASVNLACLSAAVETRENAVIAARTKFDASIIAALQARRDALKAAFLIVVTHDRQVAINAAWKAYMDAVKKARAQYQTDVRAAWKTYATASAACRVHVDSNASAAAKHSRDDDEEGQNEKKGSRFDRDAQSSAMAKIRGRGFDMGAWGKLDLSF